ncbi:aggregation-promoting factor C-terminal-like domain-containing protein [Nocardioides campestrisoli]|uniref:aggregation-promoting factor C-terminal-like domain-containing protein n=1 Tax=Nocardioides campestrisoli TaxID=2736757 RepID=UPI00163D8815|nr:hypothetical protein [Nocardioides campestrisoli]
MVDLKKFFPQHRASTIHQAGRRLSDFMRRPLMQAKVAGAASALAVAAGMLASPPAAVTASEAPESGRILTVLDHLQDRDVASRAGDRAKKAAVQAKTRTGKVVRRVENLKNAGPKQIARALMPEFGFPQSQFGCLDKLYVSESNWRVDADNPTSSAYGIPQALTQLHDLPHGYMTNPEVQIRWGLGYIKRRYGNPCVAWQFKAANNWY